MLTYRPTNDLDSGEFDGWGRILGITRETDCHPCSGSQGSVALRPRRTSSTIGMQRMAPGAAGSSTVKSDLLRNAAPAAGGQRLLTIDPPCAMPSIGPVRCVLPETAVHGVISRPFCPIFARVQYCNTIPNDWQRLQKMTAKAHLQASPYLLGKMYDKRRWMIRKAKRLAQLYK